MENSAVQAEKKPFITIGIASYNYAEYLPKAFEAICRQKFTDYEILYCDDGSTDDSLAVIRGLIADHPEMQIRLVAGENGGIMTNKNRILENARGEYLMICDADDWMDDNCLQVLGETARRTGADRVVSSAKEVDDDGRVVNTFPISDPPSKWAYFVHHGVLYRRSVLEEHHIRFSENCYPDDFYLAEWFNVYAKKTVFCKEQVYNRLVHASSTSAASMWHPESAWHCIPVLDNMLEHASRLLPLIEEEKDRKELELVAITRYYDIIYNLRVADYKTMMKTYKIIRQKMRHYFPGYLKSYYVTHIGTAPVSAARRPLLLICLWSEKLHLMWLALTGYWCLTHLGVAQSVLGVRMGK